MPRRGRGRKPSGRKCCAGACPRGARSKGLAISATTRDSLPSKLELIVDWEEGGAPEGEPKDIPQESEKPPQFTLNRPADTLALSGDTKLTRPLLLGALWPDKIPDGTSFQMTAELPDGSVYPLLWLQDYKMKFNHPFLLRTPLQLPAGTLLRGVPQAAKMSLIPAADVPPPPQPSRVPQIAAHAK